jgi:tetratricopeptide (TPR) repeat protein
MAVTPPFFPHQSHPAEQIRRFMTDKRPQLCVVRGPSGSGKTWLATHLLGESAADTAMFVVQGQHTLQTTPLACWRLALHGRRSRFRRAGAVPEITQDTMKAASKVTLGLSELVNVVIGASKRFRKAPLTLTDEQFAALYELGAVCGDKSLVLVADDLQWWDDQSIVLLRAMLLPAFVNSFPFLARVMIVAVLRSDLEPSASVARLLNDLHPPIVSLELPDVPAMAAALQAFGIADIDANLVSALHAATGGHLQLVREVARYMTDESARNQFTAASVSEWSSEQRQEFLRNAIRDRLASAGSSAGKSMELLEVAATIGVAFSEASLRCMTRDDPTRYEQELPGLLTLGILERNGQLLRFAHEILQYALVPVTGPRRHELHRHLSDCVRLLNPADYDERAFHHFCASEFDLAQSFATLGSLARVRRGLGRCPSTLATFVPTTNEALFAADRILNEATDSWLKNAYSKAVEQLKEFPADIPSVLLAERAYLLSDSLMKSIEAADRLAAIDLLGEWRLRVQDEFELWFRLSTALMVAHSHMSNLHLAREVEQDIIQVLDKRRSYDPEVEVYVNTLYRKSDAIHEIEIVARRQQEAVRYFRGDELREGPRHPAEYARSAANLIGTLVVLGEYTSAIGLAEKLTGWLRQIPPAMLPRPTVALNNLLLAQFLSKDSDISQVVTAFEELLSDASRSEDKLLIQNNLATMQIHASSLNTAIEILEKCDEALGGLYRPDPYYSYFIRSNLAAVRFHASLLPDPYSAWQELSGLLSSVHEPLRPFLQRRHELLVAGFSDVNPGDLRAWDSYLQSLHPRQLGRPWTFYGRGFLLSDIQHWSDG